MTAQDYLLQKGWIKISETTWLHVDVFYEVHTEVALIIQKKWDFYKSLPWYKKLLWKFIYE